MPSWAAAILLYGSRVLNNLYGAQPTFALDDLDVPFDSPEFVQFQSVITDGTLRRVATAAAEEDS